MDSQDKPDQPRQPQNMEGLLRFALETTRSEDAPEATDEKKFDVMNPERRAFLEAALKSLTIDVIERLENAMKCLQDPDSSEEDEVNALEVVTDFVENIDTANDFCKIGGLTVVDPGFSSSSEKVRTRTCSLVAELAQNNPFCQEKLLDIDVLPKLVGKLSDVPSVASAAMHAISCMIRGYEPALTAFITIGGFECVVSCIQGDQSRVAIKAAFLINALCSEFPNIRDELIKLNAIERIASTLKPCEEYDSQVETTLSALSVLSESDAARSKCREPGLQLRSTLDAMLKAADGKPECQEITDYCQQILTNCFSNQTEDADR